VLILNNAGVDLEHCTLASLVQAKSILLQTCLSLAAVERVRGRDRQWRFGHRHAH